MDWATWGTHRCQPPEGGLLRPGADTRTRARAEGLPGAVVADTPLEAASAATVVLTMLADDAAIESVLLGKEGAIAGMKPGTLHLGMSTISVALARRLEETHRARGQAYVSAPVFGRPEVVAQRQLWIVCGGARKSIEQCRPDFSALGRGVSELGTAPQANLAKLTGNFLIAAHIEALGEALVLGEKGGIDPNVLLSSSSTRCSARRW